MTGRTLGTQTMRRRIQPLVVGVVLLAAVPPLWLRASDVRHLEDGTRVQVKLLGLISSETSKIRDAVPVEVASEVIVDGAIVISRGTPVSATIVDAAPARLGGPPGRLALTISHTRSVDGQTIPLRSAFAAQDGRGIVIPRAMRKNLLVWVADGTMFDVVVDGDHVVAVPPPTPPETPDAQLQPPRPAELTNDDVVKLVAAGISEDVIVTLIQASRTRFQLGTDDLPQLKKAGVSDRVVIAMIEAARGRVVPK